MVRCLIAIVLTTLLCQPIYAASDPRSIAVTKKDIDGSKRVALVIGNSKYINSPLKNPVNDSKDIAAKLRKLGFVVVERNNLTAKQIGGTLREFRSKLEPGAIALVFYAGHGLQIKGDNYLPAVDADINSEEDVQNQSLAVKQIMDVLDESKSRLNLVFLDACRNNPYARSFRSSERGLARVNAPSGTLISYATKPGSVAADGDGRNGLYTSKLLAQMDSNIQIEQALKRVVTAVKTASNGKQEPWMEGSIEGDFCFGGCVTGGQPISDVQPAQSGPDAETEAWSIVKETTNAEVVSGFLQEYPKGKYASPARLKLIELESNRKANLNPSPALGSNVLNGHRTVKGIAIMDFNSPATNPDAGKIATDSLRAYLARNASSNVKIQSREHLNSLLRQIETGQAGLYDIETAKKSGKLNGTDLLIFGSLLQYVVETNVEEGQKMVVAEVGGRKEVIRYKVGTHRKTANVTISYRVIDVESGNVVITKTLKSKKEATGNSSEGVDIAGIPYLKANLPLDGDLLEKALNEGISDIGKTVLSRLQNN